jgi:hypothetical protein
MRTGDDPIEPPDYVVPSGLARQLERELTALSADNEALRKENDFLRAHSGTSAKACVYCGLGADEQGKCASGFPGCDRADDQQLCRNAFVAMERDDLLEANEELQHAIDALFANAHIIWRSPLDPQAYPIEHHQLAKKDSRILILASIDAARKAK